jgi:hypothetical protein
MNHHFFLPSLTRISDLRERPFEMRELPRDRWGNGDYVVGEVVNHSRVPIELQNGRMAEVFRRDLVVGALGRRHATLEASGTWEAVEADGLMHVLTGAGLLGRVTSVSRALLPLVKVAYRGHVHLDGRAARMDDYVDLSPRAFDLPPVVLVIGTSMSAGKTTTARLVVRRLKMRGLSVAGAKLTGAGRYRDVLSLQDAGADAIFDFVDVGLPSSICSPEDYRTRVRALLAQISATGPDVVVAEAGASPLEPYNGDTVMEELGDRVRCLILAAADPYATLGVQAAFGVRPDLVTGLATSTVAGCELVVKLTGLPAINVLDPDTRPILDSLLEDRLALAARGAGAAEPQSVS